MADFQCVAYFEDMDFAFGNTEVYWWKGTDINAARTAFDTLAKTRVALSCPKYYLRAIRVSDVNVWGDSLITLYGDTQQGASPGTKIEFDQVLLLHMIAQPAIRGHKFLHSIDRAQFTGRNYTPGSAFQVAFGLYTQNLTQGFQLRKRSKDPTPVYTFVPIVEAQGERMSRHKVGRPFGLLRGRRF